MTDMIEWLNKLTAWYGGLTADQRRLMEKYLADLHRIETRRSSNHQQRHQARLRRHWGPSRLAAARRARSEER